LKWKQKQPHAESKPASKIAPKATDKPAESAQPKGPDTSAAKPAGKEQQQP
jgi:hypothetical protein